MLDVEEVLAQARAAIVLSESIQRDSAMPAASDDYSASLVLVCEMTDCGWATMLSHVMHDEGLVSDEEGFCALETDADHVLHVRSVTVPGLSQDDVWALLDQIEGYVWECPEAVSLTIRSDQFETVRWVPG